MNDSLINIRALIGDYLTDEFFGVADVVISGGNRTGSEMPNAAFKNKNVKMNLTAPNTKMGN